MKKLKTILFIILLIGITNNSNAQELYGKWVLPTKFNYNIPSEDSILLLEFYENGIQYSTLNTSLMENSNYCEIAAGGYNASYNLDFYVFDHFLCTSTSYSNWMNTSYTFQPEYQIINRPGTNNEYYSFFVKNVHHEAKDFLYNVITYNSNNNTVSISEELTIYSDFSHGYSAFAITDLQNNERYLFQSARNRESMTDAGLRRWTINSAGISNEIVIIDSDHLGITEEDFDAYNLEQKIDDDGHDIIAWTHGEVKVDQIVVINNGTPKIIDLNFGRIGGIEFSSINDSVLYASCTDTGIISLNYVTENVIGSITSNGEYGRTFLQTAPDGNIYAVSNDGYHLGRINMQTEIFEPEVFDISATSEGYIVSTYREFDNLNYFILPENSRTHCPLSATVELKHVCPDHCDGEAWIIEDDITCGQSPYQYTWYNAVQQIIATNTNHIYNLCKGNYIVEIQDAHGQIFTEDFEIDEDIFDINVFEIITIANYEPSEWNEIRSRTYQKGFKISAGVDVTITNSNLYFGKYARIVIEPGASLTVNGSTLDYFEPCLEKWRGVEVAGVSNQPQRDQYGNYLQGRIVLENNSVISNAENAVSLYTCNYPNRDRRVILWTSSGGVVQVNGSDLENGISFINNTKSVHFIPYQNTHPITGDPMLNASYFNNCSFDINSNYIDHSTFYKHIDLNRVNGIEFRTCIFTSIATDGVSNYNSAIAAYGAGFSVESTCSMPPPQSYPCDPNFIEPSSFDGFYRAISSTDYAYNFIVCDAEFTNNVTGIYTNVNYATIINSDFEVGHIQGSGGDCDFTYGYGIDIHNAFGFAIEDNEFTKKTGVVKGEYVGIRVFNCPSVHDIIYRNSFDGLSFGNYAEGKNRYSDNDQEGVEYQCNKNTNNAVDFIVTDEDPYNAMIRTDHGTDQISSGNTFSSSAVWHFSNKGWNMINWFYCENCPNEEPEYIYTLDPIFFHANYQNVNPNNCPDHYGGGGQIELTTDERLQKEIDYAENLSDFNSVVALYESLEDGGDTEVELIDIQTAQPNDMWALRTQLLGHSPHLSQEVLRETSDRTDVFPDDILLEILSANPDELGQDTLLSYLENKENPLPDYMINILRQVAQGISYKTILKRNIAEFHAGKSQSAQDIIRSILCDTVVDLIQYRNWLDNLGGMSADKQIIASYLSEGDTTNAMSLLYMLPSLYELQGDELVEYNDYKNIVLLKHGWKQAGINITGLDSSNIAILNDYAVNSTGSAQNIAKNILSYAYNYHFCDCMPTNDSIFFKNSNTSFGNSINKAFGPKVSVSPNPARTWVAFTYELPNNETEGLIRITDISGNVIKKFIEVSRYLPIFVLNKIKCFMELYNGQNLIEFAERFKSNEDCKEYLAYMKWTEGYECLKCGHKAGQKRRDFSMVCNKCSHIESATANTLFHKVKFGIRKAFFICFEMSTTTKSLSASHIGVRFGITEKTARLFMHKVREAMKSSENHPIDGNVHIDEFVVGGKEVGAVGRSYHTKKKKIVCAVELTDEGKVKRMYSMRIDNYSSKELKLMFEKHISEKAKVVTDKWKGYRPLMKQYNIEQIESNHGMNFKALHTMIHQVKSWIRTTYSWVSESNIDRYLDEFSYRINRSQSKENIFNNLVRRMVVADKMYQTQIVCT